MEPNLLIDKTQDEARQGEAYASQASPGVFEKHFYVESYGCAMNFADSEVVAAILEKNGFGGTKNIEIADLILINTCSIREKAELTIRKRLTEFRRLKQANPGVDLIANAGTGQKAVNVLLSREETYGDIAPVRLDNNGISAFVSIMRGCNNMCSFCVVPFTRGRERSRDAYSILAECKDLFEKGYKEVVLLGQNVDSYYWSNPENNDTTTFAMLLEQVAQIDPSLRVRFSTSHPKDITDEVLHTIVKYDNICKHIHLPVQSGSTRMLQLMNRTYTREWYMAKIDRIRALLPNCSITSDIIAGFCTETEEDHQDTISLLQYANYDLSYMYFYSERPGTLAARRYEDDVDLVTKKRRLQEIVDVQWTLSNESNKRDVGSVFEVLIEGNSKRNEAEWMGRNSQNKVVVFPKGNFNYQKGDYAKVKIHSFTKGTLLGEII